MNANKFREQLKSVALDDYREKYKSLKIVEMDLPREIQALDTLYTIYWDEKRFLSFDDYYQEYLSRNRDKIEQFREKTTICPDCFNRGLPPRIYRTWASIITQIHAGYVAESVFGEGTLAMSTELDHQGADFQVNYLGKTINYQVKKETNNREVRRAKEFTKKIDGEFINIVYKVPNYDDIKSPLKRNGEYKKAYNDFKEDWLDTELLEVLENGFVIFRETLFTNKKQEIDNLLVRN